MSKLSDDEQLVKLILIQAKIMPYWSQDDDDNMKKLLSRLERGRKAIEAMGKAINCRETFLKSEMSVLGDLDMAADNFASSIHKIIEGYQQSCKEAADGD